MKAKPKNNFTTETQSHRDRKTSASQCLCGELYRRSGKQYVSQKRKYENEILYHGLTLIIDAHSAGGGLAACARHIARLIDMLLHYQLGGSTIFSTSCACSNSGEISSSVKPAMPQPMRVTRNVSSGCCLANPINSST